MQQYYANATVLTSCCMWFVTCIHGLCRYMILS